MTRSMKTFAITAVTIALPALFLCSCETWIPARHQVPFNEREFASYAGRGSGTVEGVIAVNAEDDGELHVGAGSYLTLLPVTSYTTEMVDREIRDGENLTSSDSRLRAYVRGATADDGGNFVFNDVPAGEYYLTGLVEWYVADDAQYQWACETISVKNGQTIRVKVSRNIHRPGSPYLVVWRLE